MEEKRSRLEEVQNRLYSKTEKRVAQMRPHELSEKVSDVPQDWVEKEPPHIDQKIFEEEKTGPGKIFWLLIASIIFFLSAASYAGYSLLKGGGAVSPENINVEISGPVSTPGGEKLSLDVAVVNKNKAALRTTELVIEYPPGTRRADNGTVELTNERIYLGDVAVGESKHLQINAVLFGEEQTVSDIKMSLEYRIPNSNSIFSKEIPYQIVISSNPLSLSVDAPQETTSGENMTLSVTVRSNASETVRNVLLEAQYPAGFTYKESSLKPSLGKNVWQIGDLPPGQSKTIKIIGVLSGENEDARTFRFESGVARSDNENAIETPFAGFKNQIAIKKSFIGVSLRINGLTSGEVALSSKQDAQIEITYNNNLLVPVRNVSISLLLGGSGLNESSIKVDRGFYQSGVDTVFFDKSTVPELAEVPPGGSGTISFSLKPDAPANKVNPEITIAAKVSGERTEESGVPEQINSAATRRILVQSNTILGGGLTYTRGALPPKVEKETVYTVTWSLSNSSNDVSNAKVKATLPSYVSFIGDVNPGSEKVSFNETDREITWDAGSLRAGTGFSRAARTVTFKIKLNPSISQVGQSPTLVNEAAFTGEDSFTKTPINTSMDFLTTRLSGSTVQTGSETVIP